MPAGSPRHLIETVFSNPIIPPDRVDQKSVERSRLSNKEPGMPDEKAEIRDLPLRQGMLWTRLFEAFWIALLDPAKLFLAAMAIVVMYLGLATLSWVFSPSNAPKAPNPAEFT